MARDGTVSDYATNLLNFNPTGKFPGTGEQGLTGIVVDPATGDVYASMLYSRNPADDAAPHYPMVVRFESLDGGRTAATQSIMLDLFPESQGQSHQISHLSIGPDNKFYVHMADGFVAETARDLRAFRGKILRMNLDGSPAADNPFYDASDGLNATDYVYASGFRNPFGGAWSVADGFLYIVENGPTIDRFAQIVPGRDYLWEGSNNNMRNFAIYNWTPSVAPVNITFIQPETFNGSGFPAEKMDHAFVSESGSTWASGPILYGKRISEFVVDASGTLVSGPVPLIEYNGAGKATVVALAAGPDGLYFSDFYKDLDYDSPIDRGANILRVVPEVTPLLGYTFVARLTVPVDGSSVTSIKPLESGVIYKIRASGTFSSSGTDDSLADAEYTGFNDPLQFPQDTCSDATQLVNLGIGINDAVIDQDKAPFWGDFNPTHVYTIDFIGQGAPITLNYHDCNVADNTGVLKIEIFQPAVDETATFVVQQAGL